MASTSTVAQAMSSTSTVAQALSSTSTVVQDLPSTVQAGALMLWHLNMPLKESVDMEN